MVAETVLQNVWTPNGVSAPLKVSERRGTACSCNSFRHSGDPQRYLPHSREVLLGECHKYKLSVYFKQVGIYPTISNSAELVFSCNYTIWRAKKQVRKNEKSQMSVRLLEAVRWFYWVILLSQTWSTSTSIIRGWRFVLSSGWDT